jgi:hypothetical protein
MPSVFLSHSWKDKAFARKLASELQRYNVDVWIDEAELRVGDSLLSKISVAIDHADFVAVVISHSSVNSNWVQKELALAMTKELAEKKVKVLPILKEACEIPVFLKDKLYADFTDPSKFDAPFTRLLQALGVSEPTIFAEREPQRATKAHVTGEDVEVVSDVLETFVDIRITGVDKENTYKPDEFSALYYVYLNLSATPPQEWVEIFEAERQFPRHSMWRHAWVEGDSIVVHCVPEELKKYHLADLKQDVETSNAKYREYLRRLAIEEKRGAQREKEERDHLDADLDGLQF